MHLSKHDLCVSLYKPKKHEQILISDQLHIEIWDREVLCCAEKAYFATYLESHQKIRWIDRWVECCRDRWISGKAT